mgnify:CR=1 FL=1
MSEETTPAAESWLQKAEEALQRATEAVGDAWKSTEDVRGHAWETAKHAAAQAELWRKGLASWDQDGERIRRLREAADFSIYTPGSEEGVPVSMLKSF